MIASRERHAANKKDPAAEKIRLDKLEEEINSGKYSLKMLRAKQIEGLSLIVANAVKGSYWRKNTNDSWPLKLKSKSGNELLGYATCYSNRMSSHTS